MRRTIGRGCRLFPALALALGAGPAGAQAPPPAPEAIEVGDVRLSPSLSVRLRGEYRRDAPDLGGLDAFGRASPPVRDAWVVMERSRLGVGAERGAVRAQLTLQDARALGSPVETASVGRGRGVGTFEPYEAYAEVRSSGARPHWVRAGRQAVVWGEGRLIGDADFAPAGRSLDAGRAHLSFGDLDVEALAALLEAPSPLGAAFSETAGPYRSGVQLYGAALGLSIAPLLKLEAFGIARVSRSSGAQLDGSRFARSRLSGELYTGALRASGDERGWRYGVEGAYQLGSGAHGALRGADVAAWAASLHVERALTDVALSPTLRVGASYASGDDGRGAYKQFDPLLADPQRFHGQMDLFAWSNAMDVQGGLEITPSPDASVALAYRYARLADADGEWIGGYLTAIGSASPPPAIAAGRAAASPAGEEELGHELDVVVAYRPWVPLELRIGWSALLLGDGARAIMAAHGRGPREGAGGASPPDVAQYAYVQATLDLR